MTAKVQFLGRDQTRYLEPSKIIDGNIILFELLLPLRIKIAGAMSSIAMHPG